jgi:hypothetical protein
MLALEGGTDIFFILITISFRDVDWCFNVNGNKSYWTDFHVNILLTFIHSVH